METLDVFYPPTAWPNVFWEWGISLTGGKAQGQFDEAQAGNWKRKSRKNQFDSRF
jgi:hypothetical protein